MFCRRIYTGLRVMMILIWHLQYKLQHELTHCPGNECWQCVYKSLRKLCYVFLITGVYSHANLTLSKIFLEVTSGSWLQTLVPVDRIQGVTVQRYSPPSLSWALWMFRVNFLGPSRSRLQSLLSLRGVLCTTPQRSTPANRDARLEPFRRLRNHFSSYVTSSDVREITSSLTQSFTPAVQHWCSLQTHIHHCILKNKHTIFSYIIMFKSYILYTHLSILSIRLNCSYSSNIILYRI